MLDAPADDRCLQRLVRWRLLFWVIGGLILLIGLGIPPVSRTQEARVLETARQMLGQPFDRWMVPELNGELRLQKPPLAYWYTAAAFTVGGVSDFVGRLPTALLAWLTLGATCFAANRLYGRGVGMLAAMMLLGSLLFARHARLAETDLPATLFITLAIACHIAMLRPAVSKDSAAPPSHAFLLTHAAAACIALTALAKGLPFLFPLLFIIASCILERRRDLLRRYLTSGAIATFALILMPWFVYIALGAGPKTFIHEVFNTAEGGGHGGWGFEYIGVIGWGAAPWSILFALAIYELGKSWKADPRSRLLLIWAAAILIPLLLNGNKQKHYLLPLMPAIMTAAAWWAIEIRRRPKIACAGAAALAVAIPLTLATIVPRFDRYPDDREIVRKIQETFGNAPLAFYGDTQSIVLCFELQQAITYVETPEEANEVARDSPNTVLIVIEKDRRPEGDPPPPYREVFEYHGNGHLYEFYATRG